ncbi:unnamed protein product [Didymodactylos carnosus]|uniref:Pentapeptide repeat-containing protein n=1 Tax=Didymodactylos carnosus TaxID=1234261 RepID=A0A815X201_9BILA|nr:unnamed protein product [Didymodactylos carnosus]CAF4409188.1 unnamed protein product [Didymodactylos carnosus]
MHRLYIAASRRQQDEEVRQDAIYAAYIKDMRESLMETNDNNDKTEHQKFARAQTLSALRQLDSKRKTYIIQFLVEAELLSTKKESIDLSGADLDDIVLSGNIDSLYDLKSINLCNIIMTNATFIYVDLFNTDFSGSTLTGSCFVNVFLYSTNFDNCQLSQTYIDDIGGDLIVNIGNANLRGAIFRVLDYHLYNTILPNGSYMNSYWSIIDIDHFNNENLVKNGDAEVGECKGYISSANGPPFA